MNLVDVNLLHFEKTYLYVMYHNDVSRAVGYAAPEPISVIGVFEIVKSGEDLFDIEDVIGVNGVSYFANKIIKSPVNLAFVVAPYCLYVMNHELN